MKEKFELLKYKIKKLKMGYFWGFFLWWMFDISLKTKAMGLMWVVWVRWVRKKFEFLSISLQKLVVS